MTAPLCRCLHTTHSHHHHTHTYLPPFCNTSTVTIQCAHAHQPPCCSDQVNGAYTHEHQRAARRRFPQQPPLESRPPNLVDAFSDCLQCRLCYIAIPQVHICAGIGFSLLVCSPRGYYYYYYYLIRCICWDGPHFVCSRPKDDTTPPPTISLVSWACTRPRAGTRACKHRRICSFIHLLRYRGCACARLLWDATFTYYNLLRYRGCAPTTVSSDTEGMLAHDYCGTRLLPTTISLDTEGVHLLQSPQIPRVCLRTTTGMV